MDWQSIKAHALDFLDLSVSLKWKVWQIGLTVIVAFAVGFYLGHRWW